MNTKKNDQNCKIKSEIEVNEKLDEDMMNDIISEEEAQELLDIEDDELMKENAAFLMEIINEHYKQAA